MNPTTYTPAILVTGRDPQGNEYTYWKTDDGWYNGYDEVPVNQSSIVDYIFDNVVTVRFGISVKLTRAEWIALDAPLEISSEQMNDLVTIDYAVNGLRTMNTEPTLPELAAVAYMDGMHTDLSQGSTQA